jgi:peptidoglycan/LPS O-acetylase OafA/YrhL
MKFFSLGNTGNRVFGLDLLRFIAILMVLLGHGKMVLPQHIKPIFDDFLLDGVAIFFVLSGFLIGGILIKQLEREQPTLGGLTHFWKRRWMRTLPAYLVVLVFLLVYT